MKIEVYPKCTVEPDEIIDRKRALTAGLKGTMVFIFDARMLRKKPPETIDAYITGFPHEVQERLQRLRQVIVHAAPDAEEAIRYQMPTFRLVGKNLVHFAAFAHHIGFYPTPSGIVAFKKELSAYKQGKGSVQFPLDEPLPYDLVKKIVMYRVRETLATKKKSK